jgi:hypothetical protein
MLVWKPQAMMASFVRFEGVNCQADIAPYLRNGRATALPYRQRVEECFEFELCRRSYLEFCSDYNSYLR